MNKKLILLLLTLSFAFLVLNCYYYFYEKKAHLSSILWALLNIILFIKLYFDSRKKEENKTD